MRKVSVLLAVIAIIVCLAAITISCSQRIDESGMDESPPSSFSAGESSGTPEPSEEPTATAEPATTSAASIDESEQSTTTNGEKQQSGGQTNGNGTSKPPQTTPSQPPVTTEPPKTDPPATPTPQPTEPPKPKTAYDAPYDTAQIIAEAKAYGESIGMTWSAPLTKDNCSWEAPIQTSSVLSGERLKAAIESGIRRVKKLQADNEYQPGEFHFQLYLEPFGNGEYSLYFLMG
ncbi:hypothetical protein FACS18947_0760 [Bacteroidia bacterium]|nr:hypothetical protein FACS18947_0760 [Bacteroidia bacterium]